MRLKFSSAVFVSILLYTYCLLLLSILVLSNYLCWGLQKFVFLEFSYSKVCVLFLNYILLKIGCFGLSILRVWKFLCFGELNSFCSGLLLRKFLCVFTYGTFWLFGVFLARKFFCIAMKFFLFDSTLFLMVRTFEV